MIDQKPSVTAVGVALMRAAHQLFDSEPRLFDDPTALALLGPGAQSWIERNRDHHQSEEQKLLRCHVVLRSRFAEDRLARAVERGVGQYVVLGAGFDTFALRRPAWAQGLRIFEVDHQATQSMKRSLIESSGLTFCEQGCFADVDFERESLQEGLARHGVSFSEPAFFSWLGVTVYLREEAIDAVLRTIASFPPGSEVVLTFRPPLQAGDPMDDRAALLVERVADFGEPFVSFFTPEAMEEKLHASGFTKVEFLTPDRARERYLSQCAPALPDPPNVSIVSAVR